MGKYKIFDFHTHIYPEAIADKAVVALNKFYEFTCDCGGTYAELERSSVEGGASGFLMLGTATNAHQVEKVNDYVAECVKRGRDKKLLAYGFGAMHQDTENFEREIEHIEKIGLCGVKIHPDIQAVNIDDEKLMPLYAACEGRLPIYFHIGDYREQYRFSEIKRLAKVVERYPNLTVIAAHLGGYSAWDVADALNGYDKVYYDTSSALKYMTARCAEKLVEKLGYERIMFATDFPCTPCERDFERFMKLDLSEEIRRAILFDNAEKFFAKYGDKSFAELENSWEC